MPNVTTFHDDGAKTDWLLAQARAHGGLAPVDAERFWADQEVARADPFGDHIAQCALGIMMSGECVYAELGIDENHWRYEHDDAWRIELNAAYNDRAEKIVGRRLLSEAPRRPDMAYRNVGGLHDVFEGRQVWNENSQSWWLASSAGTPDELKALLDRVEGRLGNLRAILLPDDWDEQKGRLEPLGVEVPRYRNQRGPVTFATSIYGVENLIFLIADNPPLAARFRDAILAAMLEIRRVMDAEAGYTPETAPRGFGFADDNCALLTPAMYELFGYPILKGMWDSCSPDPADRRGQHSDSDMAHIVPILGRLNLTDTNFGPNVMCDWIRRHMPRAVIMGELAPFTFSRNDAEGIVREFLRDFGMTKASRGLLFTTAGSINNGSRLTGLRLIMSAIQHFGRFDE